MNEQEIEQLIAKKIKAEKENLAAIIDNMFSCRGEIVNATGLIMAVQEWAQNDPVTVK